MNDEVRDNNREFLQDFKYKNALNTPLEKTKQMKDYEDVAKASNENVEDLYDQVKDFGNISRDIKYGTGELRSEVKHGFDKETFEDNIKNNSRDRGEYKDLKEYAQEDSDSEREEEGLYKHY